MTGDGPIPAPTETLGSRVLPCLSGDAGRPSSATMIIFGASGDLTERKLVPALFRLFRRGLLPERFAVVGCARSDLTDDAFRERLEPRLRQPGRDPEEIAAFLGRFSYLPGDYGDAGLYARLGERLEALDREMACRTNRLFYLSTPPTLIGPIADRLAESGLARTPEDGATWAQVVVEKPFGHDLASARALDARLHRGLTEEQIYRIDHYLGKETVQSLLMFRFANSILEPLTNRRHVDHVQITVAESVGVGSRAGYYDRAGVVRDMFQNHMLKMLALVAMEPPTSFEANSVRDEMVKLLRSVRPFPSDRLDDHLVRGQYGPGTVDGEAVPGYRDAPGVAADSTTDTYLAARLMIDNWRWSGVPFYLRSGKRLPRRVSEIAIRFRPVPHSMFHNILPGGPEPNELIFNVQPDEGATLRVQSKKPGPRTVIGTVDLEFSARETFGDELTDAYERLLMDCMLGDQTLFVREDMMELEWALITPVLDRWRDDRDAGRPAEVHAYPAGTWGPAAADALLGRDGNVWRTP